MKQEVSALMDGELFEDEAERVFGRLKQDPSIQEKWAAYHLIGDVLRQPDCIYCDISAKVRERLSDEPTVLAPRGQVVKQKARMIVLSAAASLSAISIVAWMSLQITASPGSVTTPKTAMQQMAMRPASMQIRSSSNDYLLAHQEFSPSTLMNGGATYIRSVSYGRDEAMYQTRPVK